MDGPGQKNTCPTAEPNSNFSSRLWPILVVLSVLLILCCSVSPFFFPLIGHRREGRWSLERMGRCAGSVSAACATVCIIVTSRCLQIADLPMDIWAGKILSSRPSGNRCGPNNMACFSLLTSQCGLTYVPEDIKESRVNP